MFGNYATMYPRILNYYLGMTLISTLCQYPKHRNRLLNISHLVGMVTNTQDPAKAKITTVKKGDFGQRGEIG